MRPGALSGQRQGAGGGEAFEVIVRPTAFQSRREPETDKRVEFQMLYKELIEDEDATS